MKTITFIGEESTLKIIKKCSNDTGDYQYRFVASNNHGQANEITEESTFIVFCWQNSQVEKAYVGTGGYFTPFFNEIYKKNKDK
jgi:hypothetical protein